MLSTVTGRRRTAGVTQDAASLVEEAVWVVVFSDVQARLGSVGSANASSSQGVGATVEVEAAARVLHLQVATPVQDGDVVEITAGELVGTVWQVQESLGKDQATALRVRVTEMQRPAEWA